MSTNLQAEPRAHHVAVVGAGLIGAGWAIVFARAKRHVRVFDSNEKAAAHLLHHAELQLIEMQKFGLIDDPASIMRYLSVSPSLEHAIDGAEYVQESTLERVDVKRELMQRLEPLLAADAVVGSSTSGIGASRFTEGLTIAPRVLVVHPVNPPHLVPVVELVPSPWTSPRSMHVAQQIMEDVGQSVVKLSREIEGFVLNRLQGALLREAWALVEDGVASCEDIDKTVRDGLGRRWSFMGPFETIDLNAPGGVADYAARLGPLYQSIAASRRHDAPWSTELIGEVERQRRGFLPQSELANRRDWRDLRLMAIAGGRGDAGDVN
jgi:3-hydroxyacyl-CoA dehydrogenase